MHSRFCLSLASLILAGCFDPDAASDADTDAGTDTDSGTTSPSTSGPTDPTTDSNETQTSTPTSTSPTGPSTDTTATDSSTTMATDTTGSAGDAEPPTFESFTVNASATPDPLDGIGYVELAAEVADNVGVTSVEFYADATLVGTADAEPWQVEWLVDSQRLNGVASMTARAFDAAGNEAQSSPIELTIAIPEGGTMVQDVTMEETGIVHDLAVDSEGSVVLAGQITQGDDGNNFLVRKVDAQGNTVWTQFYDHGSEDDVARGIAVADNDDVLVVGDSEAECANGFGCEVLSVTQRYAADDGTPLWTSTETLTTSTAPSIQGRADGIAFDPDTGGVVIAGLITDGAVGNDVYARRYNGQGGDVWLETWDNVGEDEYARAVAVLADGNIALAGTTDVSTSDTDVLVQWRMPNGNLIETVEYDCPDASDVVDFSFDMAADDAGNVYVALRSCGNNSMVRKYGPNGDFIWALDESDFGDVGGLNGIRAIETGPDGSVAFTTGAGSPFNVFVAKYTQDGDEIWISGHVNEGGGAIPDAVAVDELGYVYVGARLTGNANAAWLGKFHP